MHSSNDTGAVDTLANFEAAVRASRTELQREHQRHEALVANVSDAEARVRALQRQSADALDRCETLDNECGRIAHANNQRREQIAFIRAQMGEITAPRRAIEAETAEAQRSVAATRRDLCKGVLKATSEILASLRDHDPEALMAQLETRKAENATAAERIAKYSADLSILTRAADERRRAADEAAAMAAAAADGASDNANALLTPSSGNGLGAGSGASAAAAAALEALENRFTLAKAIETATERLAARKEENAARSAALTAERDALRLAIRSFGHSMPVAEQQAAAAENAYNELLDECHAAGGGGMQCRQCGGDLGFEAIVS